jgi:signal transduction histidine kinase
LLGLYQQILDAPPQLPCGIAVNNSPEQIELLLSGLVKKQQGQLRVKNPIYQAVFNLAWVKEQLAALRPYAGALEAWVASGQRDESRLLRGQALQEVLDWAEDKNLSHLDYHFLSASQELDGQEMRSRLDAERLKEVEARLLQEKQSAKRQRFLLSLLSVGFVISLLLGLTTFLQYRKAALNEVKAIATSSEAFFASHRSLDALVSAIKARQRLQPLGSTDASLRNFSRAEQAKKKRVDIHEGLDNILLILAHRLKAKPNCPVIQVIKEYGSLPQVLCYPGLLNQAFMNILTNAIDALEDGNRSWVMGPAEESANPQSPITNYQSPKIQIRTEVLDGNEIMIRIADNVAGMTEEVKRRIFDPFFTTKPVGHGMGLGLSISYQIVVEKHGCQLQCISTPGQGTEFLIYIPNSQLV